MISLLKILIIGIVVYFAGAILFSYEVAPLLQMKIFPEEELKKRQIYAAIGGFLMVIGIIMIIVIAITATPS